MVRHPLSGQSVVQARRRRSSASPRVLAKGQSPVTARLVADALRAGNGEARTAADIAAELGIARATAQRYLAALAQTGSATMSLRYGSTGRPEHLYRWAAV